MKEIFDFILVRLFYKFFVRPRPAAKAAPDWDIDLPGMKAAYRGHSQNQGQDPLVGITMTFYLAGNGEGGKELCGGLAPIPPQAQTSLDSMPPRRQKQLVRRLIEEGDRIFRTAWEQSTEK
jgi:hypothetical protein